VSTAGWTSDEQIKIEMLDLISGSLTHAVGSLFVVVFWG
jgi:hypothetical protein